MDDPWAAARLALADISDRHSSSINSAASPLASSVNDFAGSYQSGSTSPTTGYPPHGSDERLPKTAPCHSAPHVAQIHLLEELQAPDKVVVLNGSNLDLSSLVAVARFGCLARIDDDASVLERVQASVEFLKQELDAGKEIYGITTGFGGSADTHTDQLKDLQLALLQMQLCGILPDPSNTSLSYELGLTTMSMPESWVRAAMTVRINALLRGHSAVRFQILQSLEKLLQNNIIPFVPLHGSISASGDLSPLSYIAGALEGNPDVYVWTGPSDRRTLVASDEILDTIRVQPIQYGPKEGLAIVNGTAFSVAVAGLAMHEANNLALMAQVLTAMGVEALLGSTESFDPFIAAVRPHRGQIEVARNITKALAGSKLIQEARDSDTRSLHQDRYALRTASQWLGPSLEDLSLATAQLETELNSTTDNPLIDVSTRRTLHGGNFQATSVTSSTEKTRSALQMIGKLLFAQSTELLDTKLNNGLPPNLALDDPSTSYTLKGVDINMAAYMAELGFLANPVSSHVQSAEMGNQSVNSMALVSARYTHKAVDIVSLMCAAYLYALCQALDLRALEEAWHACLRPGFDAVVAEYLVWAGTASAARGWQDKLWTAFTAQLADTLSLDAATRFDVAARALQPLLLDIIASSPAPPSTAVVPKVQQCAAALAALAKDTFIRSRQRYAAQPDATPFLGRAAARMYAFVRVELGVPLHKGLADYPSSSSGVKRVNTGTHIGRIYAAIRDGRAAKVVGGCLV